VKKLLIIATNWPAPKFSAAGVRLSQLVDFFIEENYQITIAGTADDSGLKKADFQGIELVSIQLNHTSFDKFIKALNPDVVLFDRFMAEEQFGWRVAEHTPNALRILDTEDLHSLRKTREEALRHNTHFSQELWLQNDITKREVASIYRCDLSLIISSYEMELLKPIIAQHESILLHLPFMLDAMDESISNKWVPFEERKDFIFIGFGGHSPNVDAISFLKKEIWPLIKTELPDTKLNVYGGNFPQQINEMHNPNDGFYIKGWAENANQVVGDTKVMLAPLRFGAGIKGKLLQAMRCGTPSVTTAIGAEGMNGNLDWNGKICNDPQTFAKAAIDLYQDKKEWTNCQSNGIKIINNHYNKQTHGISLKAKIEAIKGNLRSHRTKNFIGSMLQHQTMAGTKYMGKWIEEKNKKGK